MEDHGWTGLGDSDSDDDEGEIHVVDEYRSTVGETVESEEDRLREGEENEEEEEEEEEEGDARSDVLDTVSQEPSSTTVHEEDRERLEEGRERSQEGTSTKLSTGREETGPRVRRGMH